MAYKNIATKDTIKRRTIGYMKELNVYKKQYNQLIDVYSDLLLQYYILTKQFEESGYEVVMETEKSGGKKSPVLATLENLRKDIGTYSDRLMLNAKANKDSEISIKTSPDDPFNKLFDNLNGGG